MNKKQESFVFYSSFFEALQGCPDDIRLAVYETIMCYSLYDGYKPTLTGIAQSLFSLIKPQLDANFKRRKNGEKGAAFGVLGGRPKKPQSDKNKTPTKPLKNPNKTPNDNVNVNVNDNVNNTLTCITRPQMFCEWLEEHCPYIYKHYKLPSDTELEKLADTYGAETVADMCQQIENRADLRRRYTNLYRTLLNWLKRETKTTTNGNREQQERLEGYARVAAQFRGATIRDAE